MLSSLNIYICISLQVWLGSLAIHLPNLGVTRAAHLGGPASMTDSDIRSVFSSMNSGSIIQCSNQMAMAQEWITSPRNSTVFVPIQTCFLGTS